MGSARGARQSRTDRPLRMERVLMSAPRTQGLTILTRPRVTSRWGNGVAREGWSAVSLRGALRCGDHLAKERDARLRDLAATRVDGDRVAGAVDV